MTVVGITGATGVVGGALLRRLVADGYQVRALVRTTEAATLIAGSGAYPVLGDLGDSASMEELTTGCRWVFNVAGVNSMCVDDVTVMEKTNIDGVRKTMEACRRSGVERLVHTSSAVTLGEERGTVGSEQTKHRGSFLSEYERTKFLGERVLFGEAEELDVVAVNPSSVQGPGRSTGTGRIIIDVIRGKVPFLVNTPLSMVDIDDCAAGHILAAERGIPGARYVLSAPPIGIEKALTTAAEVVGRPLNPRMVSPWLVRGLSPVVVQMARWLNPDLPICAEMLRVLTFGHRYDGSRATQELGLVYRPPEQTITRLVEWLDGEGLLGTG